MKKLLILSVALATPAFAQQLDTQTTIASRVAENAINPAQVVLFDRADIEASNAQTLTDLLATQAGFQFSKTGGVAQASNLYINGLDSKQIVFLINGQRIGSATAGTTEFQLIPLEQIERVEIIKGSRASIYGADAQGGVINLITRQDVPSTTINTAIGTDETRQIGVRSAAKLGDTSVYISALHNAARGYDIKENSDTDADGYERNGVTAGVSYQFTDAQSAGLDLQANKGNYQYDSSFGGDEADFDNRVISAFYQLQTTRADVRLQAGRSSDKSWNFGQGISRSSADLFSTEQDSLDLTGLIRINPKHAVLIGADYRKSDVSASDTAYDETSISTQGGYLGYRFHGENIVLETGSRYDDDEQYGDFWSFNTNAVLNFSNGDSLALGQATAFRAPTFNELYYPSYGNPDLSVERSRIWNIDYTLPLVDGSLLISGQRALFTDQIDSTPKNIGHSEINSLTITWEQHWSRAFSSRLIQEWLDAQDLDNDRRLARRAPRVSKAIVSYQASRWDANIEGSYHQRSVEYTWMGDSIPLASYSVFNVNTNYQVNSQLSLGLRIENLLNHDYSTANGYIAEGRYAQLSGRFQF
jgi:vitamin B12 transporter